MELLGYGLTDTGTQRSHNEDAMLVDNRMWLYAVCDGFGGPRVGEVASNMTIQIVAQHIQINQPVLTAYFADPDQANRQMVRQLLEAAVHFASAEVHKLAYRDPSKAGMATTIVLMLILGRHAFIAHVGDSRVYLLRGGRVHQLTEDHSVFNDLVRHGGLTPEEAAEHPHAKQITRAVGPAPFVAVDALQVELMTGDRFVLCSDGLADTLDGDAQLASLAAQTPTEALPAALVDFANDHGGRDNVTVVAVEIQAAGDQTRIAQDQIIQRKIETLELIPMFKQLDYQEMIQVLQVIRLLRYEDGDVIIAEGTEGEELFVVHTGEVEIVKGDLVVATLGPGTHFGEMSLIDKEPRSATVRAKGSVKIMAMARAPLFALLRHNPRLGNKVFWAFLRHLNRRLRTDDQEVSRLKAALAAATKGDEPPA